MNPLQWFGQEVVVTQRTVVVVEKGGGGGSERCSEDLTGCGGGLKQGVREKTRHGGCLQVSSWSSRMEGAAICRNRERTGFWGEIMSLVSDMFSLKDL